MVDGNRTDVKSTAQYINQITCPKIRVRNPVKNTDYVHLVFLSDSIVYFEEKGRYDGRISYETALNYWENWPHDTKYTKTLDHSISSEREAIKKKFQEELEEALGYLVYVVRRELEVEKRTVTFQRGPDNLSLENIKKDERLFVYIQFLQRSIAFGRGTAFTVRDVQERKFPMTNSWGGEGFVNKEIVATEEKTKKPNGAPLIGMWGVREKYPEALFAENMTLEQFKQEIVRKFGKL